MVAIENEMLRVEISELGAELRSLRLADGGRELLWQGDPKIWARQAPVLFPIVGSLPANSYTFQDTVYSLPRHGFARDSLFEVTKVEHQLARFLLVPSQMHRSVYPFDWSLGIEYRLWKNVLLCSMRVECGDSEFLPFSIGAHPGFALRPGVDGDISNYCLEFELDREAKRLSLNAEGLVEPGEEMIDLPSGRLRLSRELFKRDALIFHGLKSGRVRLTREDENLTIDLEFPGFKYLGLWSAPGGDFVCIEPWCGLSSAKEDGERCAPMALEMKRGILMLGRGERFDRSYALTIRP